MPNFRGVVGESSEEGNGRKGSEFRMKHEVGKINKEGFTKNASSRVQIINSFGLRAVPTSS